MRNFLLLFKMLMNESIANVKPRVRMNFVINANMTTINDLACIML